jgi:hypothetical protein
VYEIIFTKWGDVTFAGWKSFRLDALVKAEARDRNLVAYVQAERNGLETNNSS